jgi:hypothetical protein
MAKLTKCFGLGVYVQASGVTSRFPLGYRRGNPPTSEVGSSGKSGVPGDPKSPAPLRAFANFSNM